MIPVLPLLAARRLLRSAYGVVSNFLPGKASEPTESPGEPKEQAPAEPPADQDPYKGQYIPTLWGGFAVKDGVARLTTLVPD